MSLLSVNKEMFDKLSFYLKKNPFEFDFKDNIYNSESIFLDSRVLLIIDFKFI